MTSPTSTTSRPRLARRAWVLAVALAAAACSSGGASVAGGAATTAAPGTTAATRGATTAATGPSVGCGGAATTVSAGEQEVHLSPAGEDRWYLRHVPPAHDGTTPLPLVVDIHGYAEGARLHTAISGMGPYGDAHGFITVTPNGQGSPVHWNANLGSPDVALIGSILDQVEQDLCVDRSRVYVTGFSNGAFMTSAVACELGDRVAAAAPVAGMRDVPGCAFSRPVPAVTFHGTADHFVEYQGGMGVGAATLPAPDGSGRTLGELGPGSTANESIIPGSMDQKIPDITATWATRNGCATTTTETAVAADVTLVRFACPAGHEVELYRVTDGGHAWPGSAGSVAIEAVTGHTTMGVDATARIWDFFAAHRLGA
ncbi:MAG: hypothetical protein U0Q07_16370 [Acidimicrobiales bacterium]